MVITHRFANKAYANWLSVDPETLIGRHISKLLTPQRLKVAMPLIEKALAGKKCEYMVTLNHKDEDRPSHILVQYLPDWVDDECRGFYAIGQDISEQHLAKQNLILRTKLLELASDIAHVASIVIDPTTEEVRLTPEAQRLLNIQQDCFVSLSAFSQQIVCSAQQGLVEMSIRIAMAQQRSLSIEFQACDDLRFFGCTGESVMIQDKPSFLMCLMDITEATRTKTRLIEAKERAHQLTAAKSQFVATISHEIRNPLHTILGLCNLLNDHCDTETQQDLTEKLRSCTEDLVDLLTNSLDSFRMDRGELHFEEEDFDLWALVYGLSNHLYGSAKNRELDLRIQMKGKIQRHWVGDSFRIKQMVGNLISNACKFTESGHVHLIVEQPQANVLQFTVADTGLGIPESSLKNLFNQLAQNTPSTARLYGGSGLGLNLVRSLVQHIGGSIEITSDQGAGTSATLQIPLKPGGQQLDQGPMALGMPTIQLAVVSSQCDAHVREMLECMGCRYVDYSASWLITDCIEMAHSHLKAHQDNRVLVLPTVGGQVQSPGHLNDSSRMFLVQGPLQPATIMKWLVDTQSKHVDATSALTQRDSSVEIVVLLVEDVKMTRTVIKSLLAKRGVHCLEAENGQRAVEIVKEQGGSIDFVLMDINMPVLNGIDATTQIREDSSCGNLAVYALTGEDEENTAHSRDWSVFDKVLSKPLKLHTLEALIDLHRTLKTESNTPQIN